MKIGYACISLGVNGRTNRRVLLKNYTESLILDVVKDNLADLLTILKYNKKNNIKLYRISSDIIPLGSHSVNDVLWQEHFKEELSNIGEFIKSNDMRVSMHPGQYTVLNSPNEEVVSKAIKDLEYHSNFLDSLKVDSKHKLVLHIGGVYGDKKNAIDRFIKNYNRLSPSVKKRLVIENDEKNYSIDDVLEISKEINAPVIFDNLHNLCHVNTNEDIDDILNRVSKTWGKDDGPIKLHYSQQDTSKKEGAHSRTINVEEFLKYYNKVKNHNPDIMLEVKDKNISAIKCNYVTQELKGINNRSIIYDEWAKYKYSVMERGYNYYKQLSKMVNENCSLKEFYNYIDKVLKMESDRGNFINTLDHVWGYVKKYATKREENHFRKLVSHSKDFNKAKVYLQKLCYKYNSKYMMKSYYFYY